MNRVHNNKDKYLSFAFIVTPYKLQYHNITVIFWSLSPYTLNHTYGVCQFEWWILVLITALFFMYLVVTFGPFQNQCSLDVNIYVWNSQITYGKSRAHFKCDAKITFISPLTSMQFFSAVRSQCVTWLWLSIQGWRDPNLREKSTPGLSARRGNGYVCYTNNKVC